MFIRKRFLPLLLILLIVGLILFFGNRIATFYTDWLWYGELGQRIVFFRVYGTRILLFFVFGVLSFLLAYLNIWLTERIAPPVGIPTADQRELYPANGGRPVGRTIQTLSSLRTTLDQVLLLGGVLFGIVTGIGAQAHWDEFLRFLSPVSFGETDPVFGRDISFYIFTLPFLQYLQSWLVTVFLILSAGVALVYLYQQGINSAAGRTTVEPHVRSHLSALVAIVLLMQAGGYYLARFEWLYGGTRFPGAGYTDLNTRLPLQHVLIAVTLLAALMVLVNVWRRSLVLPGIAVTLWGLFFLVGIFLPPTLQRLRVLPNEAGRELPYIARAITATRRAFDIEEIRTETVTPDTVFSQPDNERYTNVLRNLRVWDNDALTHVAEQRQRLWQYYAFSMVDADRYWLNQNPVQTGVVVREVSPERLDPRARTFPNLHLRYTHGYGAVVADSSSVTKNGLPKLLLKDIPIKTEYPELLLEQPRVYFGVTGVTELYVIVKTAVREFDYPTDEDMGEEQNYTYTGNRGIPLTPLNRFAFAARFGTWSIMLSQDIQPDSRILFYRRIGARIKRLAPFLLLDKNPYPVIANGNIYWIQDAFTTASTYPYSAHVSMGDNLGQGMEVNYIRGSVKAIVNAYDGSVNLYAMDNNDPILQSYRTLYPGLIQSANAIPEAIRIHLRYPEDLMAAQSLILTDYHTTDPNAFYIRNDSWSLSRSTAPTSRTSNILYENQEATLPYYSFCQLPNSDEAEFCLLSLFTPLTRSNTSAILIARNDGVHYGERVLLRFPSSVILPGPDRFLQQVRTDPRVRPLITDSATQGSQTRFGNVRIVPMENHIAYTVPIYMENSDSSNPETPEILPELRLVAVGIGDKIAIQRTTAEAIEELLYSNETAETRPDSTLSASRDLAELIGSAQQLYDYAQSALRNGDFATYGEKMRSLGDVLNQMQKTQEIFGTKTPKSATKPPDSSVQR
jgi:hypothetical protein